MDEERVEMSLEKELVVKEIEGAEEDEEEGWRTAS